MGMEVSNYIVSRDGSTLLALPAGGLVSEGWRTSQWYILHESANGPGDFDLKLVHLPDPQYIEAFKGPFDTFAMDASGPIVAISVAQSWPGGSDPGTYLVDLPEQQTTRISPLILRPMFWGRGDQRFLVSDDTGVWSVASDHSMKLIFPEGRSVSVSPDRDLVVLYDSLHSKTLVLYDAKNASSDVIFTGRVSCVVWRPESDGFYMASGEALYGFVIGSSAPVRISSSIPDGSCPMSIVAGG
jgi:hypothetical protein